LETDDELEAVAATATVAPFGVTSFDGWLVVDAGLIGESRDRLDMPGAKSWPKLEAAVEVLLAGWAVRLLPLWFELKRFRRFWRIFLFIKGKKTDYVRIGSLNFWNISFFTSSALRVLASSELGVFSSILLFVCDLYLWII
jgi:hypothetical protein